MQSSQHPSIDGDIIVTGEGSWDEDFNIDALRVHLGYSSLYVPILTKARRIFPAHKMLEVSFLVEARTSFA